MCRMLIAVSTAAIAISSSPFAQAPANSNLNAAPPAMRFEWVREAPEGGCNPCREWISASGAIVESTPAEFATFARQRDVRGATIVLDSPGGHVVQGLALGREFRRLEVTTTVGKLVRTTGSNGEQHVVLSPRAICNSMCVFLLLGGVKRHVPDEARVFVHQIWPANKRHDANAATYTAANLAAIQRVNGEISRYIIDMGADIELFEVASRIPPWEEMRLLSPAELRRMRVHTVDELFGSPQATTVAAVTPGRKTETSGAAATVNTLGWVIAERDGQRALVRQHPITIEGREIGSFEIAFTCSEKPGSYRVLYQERRMMPHSPGSGVDRLEAVGISVRQENGLLRALLMLEESAPGRSPAELLSRAHGTVAASFLQMVVAAASGEAAAASSQAGLLVATTTAEKVRTVIRVGQTGLPEGLQRLAKSCDEPTPN